MSVIKITYLFIIIYCISRLLNVTHWAFFIDLTDFNGERLVSDIKKVFADLWFYTQEL